MTESEKWAALQKTNLTDHEPFCNYGRTNGREMCTCQVLVDIVEAPPKHASAIVNDPDAMFGAQPPSHVVPPSGAHSPAGPTRSEQRARRLSERQKSAAKRRSA